MEDVQYHIRCKKGDVADIVLLPGDPGRVPKIVAYMDKAHEVAYNREFLTYTGSYKGAQVSVTSTGIGCPSSAIAVEELARIGAKIFIRVGTSGGMQPYMKTGDIGIATGAVRDEGTTRQYVPVEYPAIADYRVVAALALATRSLGFPHYIGIFHSKDSFYGEIDPRNQPVYESLRDRWKAWIRGNVLLSEMEAAVIFTVASIRGLKAGAVCAIYKNGSKENEGEKTKMDIIGIDRAIKVALEAARILKTKKEIPIVV